MRRQIAASLAMLVGVTLLLGFGYPLAVTGISQLFFRNQANGSLIYTHGKLVGSALLGQGFTDSKGSPLPRYFQPRPSAAGAGYDGASSGASNLGPSNPLLIGFVAGVNTVGLDGRPSASNPFATAADPACVPLDPAGNPVATTSPCSFSGRWGNESWAEPAMGFSLQRFAVESDWRNETLRTNLWFIPAIESAAAVLLFAATLNIDRAASHGEISLPSWVISGSPDAARQILAALAAAIITVVGVVFSVMIVTLTLASTQFGPRMLRTFIRDRGAQLTLGTFVATFFYAMLTLISIGSTFVPHLSVTVALTLTAIDLGVLIYFIHHTATSIQLPEVIASIARDLTRAITGETETSQPAEHANGPSPAVLQARLDRSGQVVTAPLSGYLQFVRHATLMRIAAEYDAVIRLHYRPGHFLTQGHPVATVWPPEVAGKIAHRLESVHITGPLRTLTQDIAFGIDQLVEIAIRALSPAVNDTFTAMTCIDWLGDSLCKIAVEWHPHACHRDRGGVIRLITVPVSYERLVARSFEKIRQAAAGMPAVLIRQLDALATIMAVAPVSRAQVLLDQAEMIQRVNLRTVPEHADQADITARYHALLALHAQAAGAQRETPG